MNTLATKQSEFIATLADPTRLVLLALLQDVEACACHFQDALGLAQPTASRHLNTLHELNVVRRARKGQYVYYAATAPEERWQHAIVRAVLAPILQTAEMAAMQKRLRKAVQANPCA